MAGGEDGKQPGMHLPGQGEMCSQVAAAVNEKGGKLDSAGLNPESFSMQIQLVLTHLEFPLRFTSPAIRALE